MTVRILYDGDCPFCRGYVRYSRMRNRIGQVELIDARAAPALVADYAARGYDIDDSFIVDTGERVLVHGAAMAFIHGQLAPGWTGLPLLANPRLLNAVYPGLRALRNGALRLLGIPLIRAASPPLQAGPHAEEADVEPVERAARRPETP